VVLVRLMEPIDPSPEQDGETSKRRIHRLAPGSTEGVGDALSEGSIIAVGFGSLIRLPAVLPWRATDIQEPWMNEGGSGNHGFRGAFLVTFWAVKK
jgi:hypothetical protein